jgi:hypothetical protein
MQRLKTFALTLAMFCLFVPMFGAVIAGFVGALTMDQALSLMLLGGALPIVATVIAFR